MKDVIASIDDGHPRFRHMTWKQVFEKQQDTTPLQTLKDAFSGHMPIFSLPLGEEEVKWTVWLTDEAVWSRYATLSMIANVDEDRKAEIRKELFDALEEDGVERNARGEVAVHGMTYLAWTSRERGILSSCKLERHDSVALSSHPPLPLRISQHRF
jgi:hypothetical protein